MSLQMFYCPPGDGENILSKILFPCGGFLVFPAFPSLSKWTTTPTPLLSATPEVFLNLGAGKLVL